MLYEGRGITVSYGTRTVLDRVDFAARAGEVTAIVGPNGSGKTTLLRSLSGEAAHAGQVHINGQDAEAMSARERALHRAVLPQSGSIAFPFNVLELVRLGLVAGLASADPGEGDRIVLAAIARVGLKGCEARMVQELSGGERQRAQLARVLVQIWQPVLAGQPRWLMLDEPVSALDIRHQLTIMRLSQDYARAGGGVIAVMHDLNLTAMFADRVSLLYAGKLQRSGAPSEVFNDRDLSACYNCPVRVNTPPDNGGPWVLPQSMV
ncbi:hemin import ATP-binding protein HmuV [Primorskyibacter flagellatus]|uniref:Hemin import ATP-binding protein HmuV n=1 Tax=Primorskyibacter flagellatus TaxID=1387277 RepID=A0A917EAH7_9RHOB|nr:heme ABC transporter ATP-binding protein [Primorskyibacter flagellatus]GGE16428.1 hemin import ATP-binding protein HmuV [Primorskyibacter flagellatus]